MNPAGLRCQKKRIRNYERVEQNLREKQIAFFSKKFDCELDESRGLKHRLGMQNNGEMTELKVWIAGEFGKLRNDLSDLRNDINALEARMEEWKRRWMRDSGR